MVHVTTHLARRHTTYHLRIKVPVDLPNHFNGKKKLKKPPKTSRLTMTHKLLRVELGTLEKTFAHLRITRSRPTSTRTRQLRPFQ
ncbi:DUF6538 domain-containing protein [Geobacter grbiciae]|uniref:DUF6538 domain-containing protein n=1 Tax=Geobacter grbiciae TaxID=155042 RepID=UPI003CCE7B93